MTKIDKYDVNYDINGNKLLEFDTLVKLSAKNNVFDWVREDLKNAINYDGTVDRFEAFKTLASFYELMKCIEENPDPTEAEIPKIRDMIGKKASDYILSVVENAIKDRLPNEILYGEEVRKIFSRLQFHIYMDIYGRNLSDDTVKLKIIAKNGGREPYANAIMRYINTDGTIDNPREVMSQFR